MPSISAVIPAYNEGMRIADTLNKVKPYVDEMIVVDDASSDDTAEVARKHGAKVITQTTNKGYIDTIKRGFGEARGDIVVTIDADGEFPPHDIPELVKPIINASADMVQGHRSNIPRQSERVLTWLAQKKANVGDSGTGMRAIRTELAKTLEIKGACICGVLSLEAASKGARILEIPISINKIKKPRKIAWFHIKQLFYLMPWLIKSVDNKQQDNESHK